MLRLRKPPGEIGSTVSSTPAERNAPLQKHASVCRTRSFPCHIEVIMRATDVGFDLQRSAQSRRAAMSKKGVARKGEGGEQFIPL